MKIKAFFSLFLLLLSFSVQAQDKTYAREVIAQLTSSRFFGRGYVNNGLQKSERFLVEEFKKWKIIPMTSSGFLQPYSFSVNTFPGKMELQINGAKLQPGKDFIVSPDSKGLRAAGLLSQKDSIHFVDTINALQISILKKLTWSVSGELQNHTSVFINKDSFSGTPETYKVNLENQFIESFKTNNICGIIKGTKHPDSLIVITAHYDHLGGMGSKTFFPGANDNASGISLLLNLAKYYSENKPNYSIGFICFSGEEAGLLGSKYFSEHPLINLNKIRFLINLDLTGTGEEGITVVNATQFKTEFSVLNQVNSERNYLNKISSRGKAANSDHFWFTQKGVPSFFIYTNGGIRAYHDIYDIAATLPLTEFDDLFRLIRDFNSKLMQGK